MADNTEKLILSISADVAQMRRALKSVDSDVKKTTDGIENAFHGIGPAANNAATQVQQSMQRVDRQTQQVTRNLGFQLNDITQGLLSGTSPFTIMAQQTSQVTQAIQGLGAGVSKFGAIKAALASMISIETAVTAGLIIAIGYVVQYFSEWVKGGQQSEAEIKKHLDALDAITQKYGELAPEAKKTIEQFLEIRHVNELIKEMQANVDAVKSDSFKNLNKDLANFENLVDATRDLIGEKPANNLRVAWDDIRKAIENNKDPIAEVTALVSQLDQLEITAPNSGFGELAKKLKTDVLPLLQQGADMTKAIVALQQALGKAPDEAVKKLKEYNDALKKLQDTAQGPMSEVDKVLEQHKKALEAAQGAAKSYAEQLGMIVVANLAMENAMAKLSTQGIDSMVGAMNVASTDLEKLFMKMEGGSWDKGFHDLSKSTAFGAFGFTKGTFVSSMRAADPSLKAVSDSIIWAQRTSLDMQKKAFSGLIKTNAAAIAAVGAPVNTTNLYMAHFLGAGAAQKILRNPQGVPDLGADTLRNHPELAGKTGVEIQSNLSARLRKQAAAVGIEPVETNIQEAQKEAEIQGEITKAFDEQTAKKQEQLKLAQLTADTQKKAASEGRAVTEEEIAANKQAAAEWGKLQGQIAGTKKDIANAKTFGDAAQSVENRISALRAEAAEQGNLGTIIDRVTYAREKAQTVAALTTAASRDGSAVTDEEKAKIEQLAETYARAEAAKKGFNDAQKEGIQSGKRTVHEVEQMRNAYASMATDFVSGFVSDLRAGKSATEALSNALGRLGDQLLDMALNALFKNIFGNMFGGLGGSSFAVTPGAGLFMQAGGTVGMSRHSDGRRFPSSMWNDAPKYGSGGLVGRLRPGEIPIIAHQGEVVIPRSGVGRSTGSNDNRSYQNNVSIQVDSNGKANLNEGQGTLLGKRLNMAVQEVIAREQRSGGLLAGTGPGAR